MSQSIPDRNVISRRRARRASAPGSIESANEETGFSWGSILILAVVVALVAAAGFALDRALQVQPVGAFARCSTAARLGPHSFAKPPRMCIDTTRNYVAKVVTTKGEFNISMIAAAAPLTVNNFIVLSVNGFYNGLTFHRAEDYVVQGGDPLGDGRGGPGYALEPESNATPWSTNSVGMARNPDGSINGSQFFILKTEWPAPGPGSLAFNQFGAVLTGGDVLPSLTPGDRIVSISVTVVAK